MLATKRNLILAWNRITTGQNIQHKRYFRHLYSAYAIALEANLNDLYRRLRYGSFEPQEPIRLFIPKPSGLQRPLTLLCLEDQIVLQATANIFAKSLLRRRKLVEFKSVFSNVLCGEKDNIFFLRDWHDTYRAYTKRIKELFNEGFCWVGEFDLAAYYDTIAHDLLLRTAFLRGGLGDLFPKIQNWLSTWSAETSSVRHGHGIPQGPIASDFLAECFLLPIDETMERKHCYLRYVDDVRIFGNSEREVRLAAIELEVLCRNRGLIPQVKKCGIRKASSLGDILQFIPSMALSGDIPEQERAPISDKKAILEFRKSLGGRPLRIQEKARARYVLYRAEPSARLVRYVLALLPHHPEHIDAFLALLRKSTPSERVIVALKKLIHDSPYQYVRGEAWQVLAKMMSLDDMRSEIEYAISIAKSHRTEFSENWGVCTFLCAAEHKGLGKYSTWTRFKPALLQALLVPVIPKERFRKGDVIPFMLNRRAIEPGLAAVPRLVHDRISLHSIGVKPKYLPEVVRHVYKAIRLVRGPSPSSEPIAEFLERSLGVPKWRGWKRLLGQNYAHACQLLAEATPVIQSGRSLWLIHQNSFNHLVFIALQIWISAHNIPGTVNLRNRKGEMKQFGILLDSNNAFSVSQPIIADAFRVANKRRNTVPAAHPYDQKSGSRTIPLKKREQEVLINGLTRAFTEIAIIVG